MKARTRRFMWIAVGVLVLCAAAAFVLNAFQSNLVFFFTPTQVLNGEAPKNKTFRIGGLVKVGSDSIATDHSSNNSECVPARTKMMAFPSRR